MIVETETETKILLSKPQFQLVTSKAKFPAFVGGLGSGKTEALVNRAIFKKLDYPTGNIGYYLPTFDLVGLIAIPRFEEKLEDLAAAGYPIPYKTVKSPRPSISIEDCGQIILRTMDNPSRIVGYEVMDSFIDEIDVLPTEHAKLAWQKILARNRQKKPDGKKNTIAVGTTPEGFKFVYEMWKHNPKPGYELIKASTYSNQHNLPADYIQDLLDNYPSSLIQAMINGEFVNLNSGSVYPEFDRFKNACNTVIEPGDTLHIGVDFNITNMHAIVHKKVGEEAHAVMEHTGVFDTPNLISLLRRVYGDRHRIAIYPDSSGTQRKSVDASKSDIVLLQEAGFPCYYPTRNPPVRDRVLSFNVMINNGNQVRKYKVNGEKCPKLMHALETQAYTDKGEPDKSTGVDHPLDASGYFIVFTYPVSSVAAKRFKMAGI